MPADTLIDVIDRGRPANGSARFVTTPHGDALTYDQFDVAVIRFISGLKGAGVRQGDRVAVQVDKSVSAIALHVALLRTGAVQLPLNPSYTEAEVSALLSDAEPSLFVHSTHRAPPAGGWLTRTLAADGSGTLVETADDEFERSPGRVAIGADDPAAMLYTSGTTGRPKAAILSHGNLAHNAATLVDAWGFTSSDHLLHVLPLFHTHGLFVALHCVLASGSSMTLANGFDVDVVLDELPRTTVLMAVPTHYSRLLERQEFARPLVNNVRLFTSGSAPMPLALHERFRERVGSVALERYGMTETSMLTSNPLTGVRKPGTVGPPLPGVRVRVVDDVDTAVTDGTVGQVQVAGPNVFNGYWRRPELQTAEFTTDGWFRTGDLGQFDDDGYLELVGRSKDLIITGGMNVYPVEVESVLDALDGVRESAVVGLPDDDFGESVTGVVVASAGQVLDVESLRTACRDRLAGFKVPKQIVIVTDLPRNAMGKVEKAKLREVLTSKHQSHS